MAVNTIRFSGLASGLDTESLVSAMLSSQKYKVDTTKQEQQLLQLKKDKWKEVNTKLLNFQKNILDTMKLSNSINKTSVSVSNPNALILDKNISLKEGNHTIEITQMAKGATVSTKVLDKPMKKDTKLTELGLTTGEVLKINGKEVFKVEDIQDDEGNIIKTASELTISDLEKAVKENAPDIEFNFDTKVNAFIISSKETGKDAKIDFTDSSGNFLNSLGIQGVTQGQNAVIKYNNSIEIESSSNNNIEINGLKFSITSETTGPINISVTKDTEQVVDFAKKFVDEYNTLLQEMNTLVGAPRNRSYMPLTAEQKKDMSEEDIKLWNQKIDTSILSGDQQLASIITGMRGIVEGIHDGNSLSEIGISSTGWKDKGKLSINEDKLRAALLKDSDKVVKTLSTIGQKLNEDFNKRLKGSSVKSGNSFYNDKQLDTNIKDYTKKIETLEDKMARMEKIYYAKFTAMEKAMSQLNSQSSSLMSQLG